MMTLKNQMGKYPVSNMRTLNIAAITFICCASTALVYTLLQKVSIKELVQLPTILINNDKASDEMSTDSEHHIMPSILNEATVSFEQNDEDTAITQIYKETAITQNDEDTAITQNYEDTVITPNYEDTVITQNNEDTAITRMSSTTASKTTDPRTAGSTGVPKLSLKEISQKLEPGDEKPHVEGSLYTEDLASLYRKYCNGVTNTQCQTPQMTVDDLEKPWIQFNDVLLVIVFNNAFYEKVIPVVELLYKPFFRNIVYCGPEPYTAGDEHPGNKLYNITFIKYEQFSGWLQGSSSYTCTALAMRRFPGFKGYLHAADDSVVMLPRIAEYARDKVWYFQLSNFLIYNVINGMTTQYGGPSSKRNWFRFGRQKNLKLVMEQLQAQQDPVLRNCAQKLTEMTGGKFLVAGKLYSDFYYIPSHLSEKFCVVSDFMAENKIFLEIAVGTILMCISENASSWAPIKANRNHYPRVPPWDFFMDPKERWDADYLHPIKWSNLGKDRRYNELLCHTVLPILHNKKIHTNPQCALSKVKRDEAFLDKLNDCGFIN